MSVDAERIANLRSLVGSARERMRDSKAYAMEALASPDHDMRAAAISVLSIDIGLDDDIAAAILRVADDTNLHVRTAARSALAHYFRSRHRETAKGLYRAVINDEELDVITRYNAYIELAQLSGVSSESILHQLEQIGEPNLADIDWSLVEDK